MARLPADETMDSQESDEQQQQQALQQQQQQQRHPRAGGHRRQDITNQHKHNFISELSTLLIQERHLSEHLQAL